MTNNSFIVTGGCGFIGSNFVNYLCETTDHDIVVIDKMTYAANEANIDLEYYRTGQVRVYKCDLATECDALDKILEHHEVDGVFHFAAESHVDNSIDGPSVFVDSNIVGTFNLLEKSLKYKVPRFLQISTDEVYGALSLTDAASTEDMPLEPNNVYSATKASAEMLVRSFHKTYGLDVVTTRCCNNYGPRQDKEKLIPKVISNALNNDPIPVYGKGDNIREWIHVHDHCTAIKCIFDCGSTGEIYNIGSGVELQNLHLVKRILSITNRPESLIQFVKDRKGHDFRYSLNFDKLSRLGWYPEYGDMDMMMEGLQETVEWFKKSS